MNTYVKIAIIALLIIWFNSLKNHMEVSVLILTLTGIWLFCFHDCVKEKDDGF